MVFLILGRITSVSSYITETGGGVKGVTVSLISRVRLLLPLLFVVPSFLIDMRKSHMCSVKSFSEGFLIIQVVSGYLCILSRLLQVVALIAGRCTHVDASVLSSGTTLLRPRLHQTHSSACSVASGGLLSFVLFCFVVSACLSIRQCC
jgi:hypothetical protein